MQSDNPEQEHGLDELLELGEAPGGLPLVGVHNDHARARICLYGGQVLSYLPTGESEDLLFLSRQAWFQEGKAIKGGIPVCWPWFGPDPEGAGRPAHGLARTRLWRLADGALQEDGSTWVRLELELDEAARAAWPQPLDLSLEVTVGPVLTLALTTRNRGAEPVTVTQGLHTYFRVGDVTRAAVHGLDGRRYIDKLDGGAEKTQDGPVTISGEVDRIYTGVEGHLVLEDPALGRSVRIASGGSASAVVWNPWVETARAMADLGDEDYRELLCVETTNAGPDAVEVPADGEHCLMARYGVDRH
jgi:glucose-6-phosphate 1-epimerase